MKKFDNRSRFSLTSTFIGLLIATHACATVLMPRQMLAAQANTRMMSDGCPNHGGAQTACSLISGDWNTKAYNCPKSSISAAALMTVTDAILTDTNDPKKVKTLPSFPTTCQGQKYYVDHGSWTLFYSVATTCQCEDNVTPVCTAATGLSEKACNIASFELCGLVEKENLSIPCTVA
ncbi:secreted protein [Melampsora americana]|nr:secreted protein [Melampsora americana]